MNRHRKEFKNIFWAQKCPIYQILDIIEIFFINPKQSFLIHYLILVIRYNFKKSNELRNTKVQKCWFGVQIWPFSFSLGIIRPFLCLKIQNCHIYQIFNSFHLVKFQKNLMNRFRKKFKCCFWAQKMLIYPFWTKQEFFSKKGSLSF